MPRRKFLHLFCGLALAFQGVGAEFDHAVAGRDLSAAFQRAKNGAPLRCVVMGGSITASAKEGWIGRRLREWFPDSEVRVINAGMSATGSELAVFRLERDVMVHQPDLVLLEFCVNDGNSSDEEAIRHMESIIVRLKQMAHPPAIVILEAAAKGGVNLQRHRRVARHYGLLEVDLQRAVKDHLDRQQSSWPALFEDEVHPNAEGHALYASSIAAALEPFRSGPAGTSEAGLPPPLSTKPLLLDATLIPLGTSESVFWRRESSLPFWWDRYFLGYLATNTAGAKLSLDIRGTTFGLFFPMHPAYGSFLVAVDKASPRRVAQNAREGYGVEIAARDLPAQEHRLEVVVPMNSDESQVPPVMLGYLLVAGQLEATRSHSPHGAFSADVLMKLHFVAISSAKWNWAGPFSVRDPEAIDARSAFHMAFPPEMDPPGKADWRAIPSQSSDWIDFRRIPGMPQPSVVYAEATVDAKEGEEVLLGFAADYFAKLWLNDELLLTLESPHNHARTPKFFAAKLRGGKNRFLVKVGSGTMGFGFSLSVGGPGLPETP